MINSHDSRSTSVQAEANPLYYRNSIGSETGSSLNPQNELSESSFLSESSSKLNFWKNLSVLCLSFLFTFTAFAAIQNLESSLNHSSGLGVASLACIYGGAAVSCLYAPAYYSIVGAKWSVVTGLAGQLIFTVTNFYPHFYSLVPSSIILGLTSGPLWTGQGIYLTQLASDYADLIYEESEHIIGRFNGIFFMFFQTAQISGNLVSSLVLFDDHENSTAVHTGNTSQCGAHFCALNDTTDNITPPRHLVYLLLGIYVGCAALGLLVFSLAADSRRPRYTAPVRDALSKIAATFGAHSNLLILLLVPLFTWSGLQQSFLFAEYTQAFISCHVGIGQVGFAMAGFGAVDALFSLLAGSLQKLTGRVLLMLFGFAVNLGLLITMLLWDPVHGKQNLIYAIPALWGMGDAIWNATLSALIGVVFVEQPESAFATFRMWQSIGFAVSFSMSSYICMATKIYFMLAMCCLALTLYVLMEIVSHKMKPKPWRDLYEPIQ